MKLCWLAPASKQNDWGYPVLAVAEGFWHWSSQFPVCPLYVSDSFMPGNICSLYLQAEPKTHTEKVLKCENILCFGRLTKAFLGHPTSCSAVMLETRDESHQHHKIVEVISQVKRLPFNTLALRMRNLVIWERKNLTYAQTECWKYISLIYIFQFILLSLLKVSWKGNNDPFYLSIKSFELKPFFLSI